MNLLASGGCGRLSVPVPLGIALRAERGSPVLANEPVTPADLADAVSEAWRDGCQRQGFPEQALADVPMSVQPLPANGSIPGRCEGFAINVDLPDGRRQSQQFSIAALSRVARRAADRLISEGRLAAETSIYYELVTQPALQPGPDEPLPKPAFKITVKSFPPACLHLPLRPLLQQATPVDMTGDNLFPVFFTAEALAKAETCSRRGATDVPPVESGGMLVGSLGYCGEAREFFVIVHDVLEVTAASQSTFSLAYSEKSWARINTIMSARQQARAEYSERLVGQCHGHNFLPNDGNLCDQCEKRALCSLSSVFASQDDRDWMSAVFSRQPWALCQIFGLTARRQPVHKLYSLKDARWQARGYFLLPEINWNQATRKTTPT